MMNFDVARFADQTILPTRIGKVIELFGSSPFLTLSVFQAPVMKMRSSANQ